MSNKVELIQEEKINANFAMKPIYEGEINLAGEKVKKLKLIGTAIVCDVIGINGRAYPKRILEREVRRFVNKFVKKGRAGAELNHPRLTASGEGKDYSVFEMNLKKTCALIEELYFEGNELKCKMRVVENHSSGKDLKALIDEGYIPGFSLRGAGSVIETKAGLEITEDYRLITIDVVGNPSFDEDALITPAYESLDGAKVKVLTEAVNLERELMLFNRHIPKISAGFKKFNPQALAEALNNEAFKRELLG